LPIILNGSVGLFHFTSIAASRSFGVWASTAAVSDISATSATAIFFTGILPFFLVTSSPCRPHVDAGFSLTTILVEKMPAAFR